MAKPTQRTPEQEYYEADDSRWDEPSMGSFLIMMPFLLLFAAVDTVVTHVFRRGR